MNDFERAAISKKLKSRVVNSRFSEDDYLFLESCVDPKFFDSVSMVLRQIVKDFRGRLDSEGISFLDYMYKHDN